MQLAPTPHRSPVSPPSPTLGRRTRVGLGVVLLALFGCGEAATTGYTARGIVRDATDGHAIANAEVTISDGSAVQTVHGGADGAFSVAVASSSGTLTATAEGYVSTSMPYSLMGAAAPLVVALQPSGPATRKAARQPR